MDLDVSFVFFTARNCPSWKLTFGLLTSPIVLSKIATKFALYNVCLKHLEIIVGLEWAIVLETLHGPLMGDCKKYLYYLMHFLFLAF